MKSAYELAMERLAKSEPALNVTDEQRAAIGEIDDKFKAKIAERELFLNDLIAGRTPHLGHGLMHYD